MRAICRAVTVLLILAYAAALAIAAVGVWGLFGTEPDALAGVYLIALGAPWSFLLDGAPEPVAPILAVMAPALNLAIVHLACRLLAGRSKPRVS